MKRKKGLLSVFNRASTAVVLVIMMVISSFSAIAVSSNVFESGAKVDVDSTSSQLTKNATYYLVGDFNNWKTSSSWKLTSSDGNLYTGTFEVTAKNTAGTSDYEFKISDGTSMYSVNGSNGSKYWFTQSSTSASGLTKDVNNFVLDCFAEANKTVTLSVKLYCEYSGDSRLEIVQSVSSNKTDSKYYTASSSVVNQTSSTQITSVNGTFYDYYNDEEINGSWRDSLTGYYRTVESGDGDKAREPYEQFNTALGLYAASNTGWKNPLYFGNFYGKSDGYGGRTASGSTGSYLKNFKILPNDSNVVGSTYGSVTGLTDTTLSNGSLTSGGVTLPYFDKDWLTSNGYGTVISSPFPMRVTTKNGQEYYEFNSNDGVDNCYFSGYSDKNFVMNYANNSHKVYDALSGFSSEENGVGFFPFDRDTEHSNNGYDFGFGMQLDIDFTLGKNGKTNGNDTVFEFTGDDDLWVYLDGVLVLDMGGDHKKSQGCIDFSTMKSYVNYVNNSLASSDQKYGQENATINGTSYSYSKAFPKLFTSTKAKSSSDGSFDNNDITAHHTLTVFYMERGMIESNLKVGFNFQPIKNTLEVDKTVDVTDVNSGVQEEAQSQDQFGYTVKADNKASASVNYKYTSDSETYTCKTTNEGKFTLGDGDTALFNDKFDVNSTIDITEGDPVENSVVSSVDDDDGRIIYLDPSSCSWFLDDGCVPVIRVTGSSQWNKMKSFTNSDNKKIYYYSIDSTKSKFYIAREGSSGVYNSVAFDIDGNKNLVTATENWAKDSTGYTFTAYSGSTPPSGTDTGKTVGNTKKPLLSYDTSWSLYDKNNETTISEGTGLNSNFTFINSKNDEIVPTDLLLSYVNKVQTGSLKISKNVVNDSDTQVSSDSTFGLKILLSFDGGKTYNAYPLKYSYKDGTGTLNSSGETGNVLSTSSSVEISGIPVGAMYQITELSASGFTPYKVSYNGTESDYKAVTGAVTKDKTNSYTITNKILPASAYLVAEKLLDGEKYTGSGFTFDAEEVTGTSSSNGYKCEVSSVNDGKITFGAADSDGKPVLDTNNNVKAIQYESTGNYIYTITEKAIEITSSNVSHDYQTDSNVILAMVSVTAENTGLVAANPVYVKVTQSKLTEIKNTSGSYYTNLLNYINSSDKSTSTLAFNNYQSVGEVTVVKTDKLKDNGDGTASPADDASLISGAEFTLYYVNDDDSITAVTDSQGKSVTQLTNANGEVKFSGLAIFAKDSNGKYLDGNNNTNKKYQKYCVKETKAADGYSLTDASYTFSFEGKSYSAGSVTVGGVSYDGTYVTSSAVVNAPITVPFTGESMLKTNLVAIGGGILLLSLAAGVYYFLSGRKKNSRVNCRHGR